MKTENLRKDPMVPQLVSSPPQGRRRGRWTWALLAAPLALGLGLGTVARAQPFGGPGMGGPGMMEGGEHGPGMRHHVEQMLTAVGASDAQKAQIKTIWDGARPQLKALHEEHEQLRKQIGEALAASTVDAAHIEQLRKQSVQSMDKLSAVMTQAFVSTANVLTPAQRKAALAKFEERREDRREGRHGGHGGPGAHGPAGPAAAPAPGAGQ
jgi:Spy/CpxP family protein refolding chaperone